MGIENQNKILLTVLRNIKKKYSTSFGYKKLLKVEQTKRRICHLPS